MQRTWEKNGWRTWHLVAALLLMTLAVAMAWNAWSDLFYIAWNDAESGHIFLVPLVAGWLVWVRAVRFRHCRPGSGWIGVVFAAVGVFLSYYGYESNVQSCWHAGALLTVIGAMLSVLGRDVLMKFLPAFCVLLFMIPVPGRIRQPMAIKMETATAAVTEQVFETIGLPVERSGNQLTYNGVPVNIVEACNGLRMVFALVLVSYAFAFTNPLRGWVRLLIVLLSPISAILCNVIRLVPTVWLFGVLPRNQAELAHTVGGWVMLGVAFLMLMGIIRVLRWALIPVQRFTLAYD